MRSAKIYRHICRQFSRLQEATAGCSRTMADVFGSGVKRLRSAADLCEQLRTEMWLGREDSNLRMVESKSGYFTNVFNVHSEKSIGFSLKATNRLAADSEWNT